MGVRREHLHAVLPALALVAATLFWSGNFIAGRALREDITPVTLNLARWALACAVLLPFAWRDMKAHRATLAAHWPVVVALGVTGVALFHSAVYLALRATPAVNALLFISAAPVVIVAGARLVFGERLSPGQALGLVTSLAGAVTLAARGSLDVLLGLKLHVGDLWMLLAVCLWAAYTLLLQRRPPVPGIALLGAASVVGVVVLVPLAALEHAWLGPSTPGLSTVLGIAYMAVFASVIAFALWNAGQARIGAGRAGLFLHLMPAFGVALAWGLLGERLQAYHFAGAALIVTGIILMNLRRRQ